MTIEECATEILKTLIQNNKVMQPQGDTQSWNEAMATEVAKMYKIIFTGIHKVRE